MELLTTECYRPDKKLFKHRQHSAPAVSSLLTAGKKSGKKNPKKKSETKNPKKKSGKKKKKK